MSPGKCMRQMFDHLLFCCLWQSTAICMAEKHVWLLVWCFVAPAGGMGARTGRQKLSHTLWDAGNMGSPAKSIGQQHGPCSPAGLLGSLLLCASWGHGIIEIPRLLLLVKSREALTLWWKVEWDIQGKISRAFLCKHVKVRFWMSERGCNLSKLANKLSFACKYVLPTGIDISGWFPS